MNPKLCRHCGEENLEADKCKTCNKVFKFVCPECNIVYEEHHTNCVDTRVMQKIIIE